MLQALAGCQVGVAAEADGDRRLRSDPARGRQRRRDESGDRDVVEAGQGYLFGHLDATFTEGAQQADGHGVVGGEDRRQAQVDHHQALDIDGDLSNQNCGAGHQQGEYDQVVEHPVTYCFTKSVGRNVPDTDMRAHALAPDRATEMSAVGCSFCMK